LVAIFSRVLSGHDNNTKVNQEVKRFILRKGLTCMFPAGFRIVGRRPSILSHFVPTAPNDHEYIESNPRAFVFA
jgi:hypothetical protein